MSGGPTREDLIEALQKFNETVEGTPTIRKLRESGPYSPYYYKDRFGTWHDALEAAGIDPTHGVDPDVNRVELVEDLRRIDAETEGPPKRTDVEERGEFPFDLYQEEFDSFIYALREAGIQPTEKQYRFSNVDTPEEIAGTKNVNALRREGPMPASELPQGTSVSDKQHGLVKFTIRSGSGHGGQRASVGGMVDPVYYLEDKHAPELVLRRFFNANPSVLAHKPPHGLKLAIHDHSPSWKEIGQELVDEFFNEQSAAEGEFERLVVVRCIPEQHETQYYCVEQTVATQVDLESLDIDREVLAGTRPVWGFPEDYADVWNDLTPGDALVFSTEHGQFTHYVPVAALAKDYNVTKSLWAEYDDGIRVRGPDQPWPYIVIGDRTEDIALPESQLADALDTDLPDGPVTHLDADAVSALRDTYGSFEAYLRDLELRDHDDTSIIEPKTPVEQRIEKLKAPHEGPPLTVDRTEFEEQIRQVRDEAFRQAVREVYPGCALCGERREAPNGTVDLDAAHIYPKAEGGPDLLQNGLALCKRHHWAFDAGWFTVDSEYRLRVCEAPALNGYEEFAKYDGKKFRLPDKEQHQPHPKYLAAHRGLFD